MFKISCFRFHVILSKGYLPTLHSSLHQPVMDSQRSLFSLTKEIVIDSFLALHVPAQKWGPTTVIGAQANHLQNNEVCAHLGSGKT